MPEAPLARRLAAIFSADVAEARVRLAGGAAGRAARCERAAAAAAEARAVAVRPAAARAGHAAVRPSTSASAAGIEKNGEWLASSVCTVQGIFACIARWLAMSIARSCKHSM